MNAIPFVRRHTSAKGLYEQLTYLDGERSGIGMMGRPALTMNMNINLALRSRRTTESSISKISEELDTSPMLPTMSTEGNLPQGWCLTHDSGVGYGIGINSSPQRSPHSPMRSSASHPQPIPQKKNKVSFRFTNAFPFCRSSKDKGRTSPTSSSKTVLSPIERSPVSPGAFAKFHGHIAGATQNRDPSTASSPLN